MDRTSFHRRYAVDMTKASKTNDGASGVEAKDGDQPATKKNGWKMSPLFSASSGGLPLRRRKKEERAKEEEDDQEAEEALHNKNACLVRMQRCISLNGLQQFRVKNWQVKAFRMCLSLSGYKEEGFAETSRTVAVDDYILFPSSSSSSTPSSSSSPSSPSSLSPKTKRRTAAHLRYPKIESNTLHQLQLKQVLGEGLGGVVYSAGHSLFPDLKFAIKVVLLSPPPPSPSQQHHSKDEERVKKMEEALKREHYILTKMLPPHPNILNICSDLILTKERAGYIMPYAKGGDLFELVKKQGKLEMREAWRLFRQLLKAVAHCHAHMICHRDIKPENIFLDGKGNALLADFGLATRWNPFRTTNHCVGSVDYAAPEVLHPEGRYIGPEVDAWSCGCVLFMMLKGHTPFGGASVSDTYQNILVGRCDLSGLHPAIADLISRLLCVDPLKRATIYDALQHLWLQREPGRSRLRSSPSLSNSFSGKMRRERGPPTTANNNSSNSYHPRCSAATTTSKLSSASTLINKRRTKMKAVGEVY
ncbi:serine threonine-protein kinase [Balamuthia mandrillaris]